MKKESLLAFIGIAGSAIGAGANILQTRLEKAKEEQAKKELEDRVKKLEENAKK